VNLRQRIRFYQQIAVLSRAGIPLRTALPRLRDRIRSGQLDILIDRISTGQPPGDAFAAAGFSPFECHLVTAGERSAQMEVIFERLGEFWARQREMYQALISQLYYPGVVLNLSILVGALLELTKGVGAVIWSLVEGFGLLYGIGIALFFVIRASWGNDAAQRFWLAVPIIGKTLSTSYAYRWITALKLEYSAGIPMPDAVADAWRASGYAAGDRLAEEGQAELREGGELSGLVQRWRQLPRDWVDFIETGEVSGALETAFTNLEEEAGRAWNLAQQRMTSWMPKILYFIVLLIAGIQIFALLYRLMAEPYQAINQALNAAGVGGG
jgi:type II secretory pathway component PulF